ncbi:MAG: FAD-dependent thymidylate synthase [Nitrososphaerota archaeon]|nr:FAD-dependent thymidylate synthase [Nitrososphaerota archaeon]MDG6943001.1 FAD-dependent thymidylate synthase [Nitrososphaerota archaeon]MDG6950730.1 FAD-dependent thymidylate synthase [Nitrososphaerota archaeon]
MEGGPIRVKLLYSTELEALKKVLVEKGCEFDPEALLDHVVYMFEIEDCSRVTTHQLVRHRAVSYDQESQRFSAATREGVVTPPSIQSNDVAYRAYDEGLKAVYAAYEKMVTAGVPKEDARYVLPSAIKTKLVMTLSARSLMHIVWQRTALQAQWEIRELASTLHGLAQKATPELWTKVIER